MRFSMLTKWILLVSLVFLQACDSAVPSVPYFPLDKGLRWEYQVRQTFSGTDTVEKTSFSMENLGVSTIENNKKIFTTHIRQGSDGNTYYLINDDTGIHRIAKRTVVEFQPRFDEVLRTVLPNHDLLDVGQLWNIDTGLYVVTGRPEYNTNVDLSEKSLNMVFEIQSLDDVVDVPAGVFENCIRVEGYASVTLYADPKLGYINVPVIQTEWYAPNVGMVKMVRSEIINAAVYQGGVRTFELKTFTN